MFSKELKITIIKNRIHLLQERNVIANEKILKKLERQLRK
jgi:hypothetical protein